MRLLIPHLDKLRPAYGMKEVVLAKYYIEILNISKESADAKKLLNFRAPHAAKQDAGDFAAVAYFVLKNRCPEKGSLTVANVNSYLNDLCMANTKRDRPAMKKALQMLLRNTSALEQKWLIRIIMKEMKTGLSENSVFAVFHPDAADLFNVCSSLDKVCSDLRDPSTRLNETAISLFQPFRPMLGQRAAIDQVVKLMDNDAFFIETKFDGDRMQLHKKGCQYKYFSRSSKDYTSSFGLTDKEGSFTPNIHHAFNSKVDNCILDGEMVGWNAATDSYISKGENVDVKALGHDEESDVQQCFVVFDVLLINDKNLANCPLHERVSHLQKIFSPVDGYLHMVERKNASTKEEVVASLNEAIDSREEGLIIKHPHSTYQPDKRKGSGWLKIKPEYVDSLSDQLDVVIVGGYYGVGHRAGMVSHFMCAVAVPTETPGAHPTEFHSFCKVGSGYTMNELRELGRQLQPYWKVYNPKKPPECLLLAAGHKEKPDLWIEPRNSKIVQIKAAEIVSSDKYKVGMTLRFPRLEKVRDDKEWYDCMTITELEELRAIASGRLTYQHADGEDGAPSAKKRKVATRIERLKGVAAQFKQVDASKLEQVSGMFKGKEFCVINGPPGFNKAAIETKIIEHGGTVVQNPGPETHMVLVYKLVVRADNIIKVELYDVVKTSWLQECLDSSHCVPLLPHHMWFTSAKTKSHFAQLYDRHGDSYFEDCTEESLKQIFQKISEEGTAVKAAPEEIALIESRYFSDESLHGLFRQCRFYLDKYADPGNTASILPDSPLELVGLDIRLHGGVVTDHLDAQVTHIVFDENDLCRVRELRKLERRHTKKHHFVTSSWVTASIEDHMIKNERAYEPKTD
ncbi:DNA ligase 4-like isoform X2 [Dysidea avara]